MRIYIASRYGRREEMLAYARVLRGRGAVITSRWLEGEHSSDDVEELTVEEQCAWAAEDLLDINQSDALWAFTEEALEYQRLSYVGRGGRHVEFGYVLARKHSGYPVRLVVVGPRENVFCCHGHVQHYATFSAALDGEFPALSETA